MSINGTTYLVVIEIKSPGHIELEAALVELTKRFPTTTWQFGPREAYITPKVAKAFNNNPPQ